MIYVNYATRNVPKSYMINTKPLISATDFKTVRIGATSAEPGLTIYMLRRTYDGLLYSYSIGASGTSFAHKGGGIYYYQIPMDMFFSPSVGDIFWFVGWATDILPFESPIYCFRESTLNQDLMIGNEELAKEDTINNIETNVLNELSDIDSTATLSFSLLSTNPSVLQHRCMNNDDLICRRSGDFVASFIYLGDLSGVTDLYFTVKPQTLVNSLPDNQATIQIQEGVGLLYINGGVAGVPANGSITITDAPAGHISINLDAVETAKLTANTKYRYDIKADHNILAEGAFFVQSAITLAV